jgi:hypothetical protein
LKTGAKIAIGCAAVVLLGVLAVGMLVFGGLWWGKQKLEQVTGGGLEKMAETQKQIESYERAAQANAFTRPEDDVVQEAQLLRFLAVRKQVFAVYQNYREVLERSDKKEPDLAAIGKGIAMLSDLRLAQTRGLAEQSMNPDEYAFLVEQVYKSSWASAVDKQTGGKGAVGALRESVGQAAQALEQQLRDNPNLPDAQRRMLEEQLDNMRKQAAEAAEQAEALQVPQANIELFRKYEAEIKQYGMHGLEALGL